MDYKELSKKSKEVGRYLMDASKRLSIPDAYTAGNLLVETSTAITELLKRVESRTSNRSNKRMGNICDFDEGYDRCDAYEFGWCLDCMVNTRCPYHIKAVKDRYGLE